MPTRLFTRAVALGAALLAAGGLLGLAAPADAAAHARARSVPALHHRTTVLLPTGEAVSYDAAHPKDLRVHTRTTTGLGRSWRAFTSRGRTYVVPTTAVPFLGTVLDPSLFDVAALAKAGERPQVTVAVAKGAKASVPGLTVTKRSRTSQRGYFTAKGAKRFGAALQRAAIDARGRAAATRTLFGAATIGTKAAVRVLTPKYPQQTVIFTATGSDGKPLPLGFLFYGDLDDAARATGFVPIIDGEVRVSLPKGRYTLYAEALTVTSDTTAEDLVVTQPQVQVTGKRNQVVGTDFRTATARPSLTVAQPTTPKDFALIYSREWPTAQFSGFVFGDPSLDFRIAPAPTPQVGTASLVSVLRNAPADSGELYTAVFRSEGAISADQSHSLTAGQLADVRERVLATGAPNPAAFVQGVQLPDGSGIGIGDDAALPFERLEHRYLTDGGSWSDSVVTAPTDLDPFDGEIDDGLRTYAPGSSRTVDWLRQAVAPAVPTFTDETAAQGVPCLACRTSSQLAVATALVDSYGSGHYGFIADHETGQPASRTRLYRGGTLIDDEAGGLVVAPVSAKDATYRVLAEATPVLAGWRYGTIARTEWTFHSSSSTGQPVGKDGLCLADGKGTCRVLPLLRIVAPLPTGLDGRIPAGTSTFPICVAPIQGASVTGITATAQVSLDDGRTFADVPLAPGPDGCATATLTTPSGAAGAAATLRITASGAGGTAVTETVRNAYRVAG